MTIPTYVAIPFLREYEMTKDLVQQLVDQGEATRIFLMDNEVVDPEPTGIFYTWDTTEGWEIVQTLQCPGWNLYSMLNYGIQLAQEDTLNVVHNRYEWHAQPIVANVALLNNDLTIDSPNWLNTMAEALRSDGNLAAVSSLMAEQYPDDPRPLIPADYSTGFQGNALMVRAELPFRYDDRYEWWYGDLDLAAQAENAGYSLGVVPKCRHTHLDGGSVTCRSEADKIDYWNATQRDKVRFARKWPQITNSVIPRELLMQR